jgi:hypothetical protein
LATPQRGNVKLNRLETHDRLEHFKKQDFDISACCQDLINQRPFGSYAFYIFVHARTLGLDEKLKLFTSGKYKSMEEVPEKTLIWQPRLTRPKPQSNSMLFKAYPGSDVVKIMWMIPDRSLWEQYEKDKMTGDSVIYESIQTFKNNSRKLAEPESDDLNDEQIDSIYQSISANASRKNLMNKLYLG